jgi:pyridoxal phosphate enzyme (YggS family)
MSRADEIAARLAGVRARIAAAAAAAGRAAGDVTLIAVSKKMPVEDVASAIAADQLDFGENYAQELRDKRAALDAAAGDANWHFIGPLQANKVKYVAGKVALLHTIDSIELLDEVARRTPAGATQKCLVQVNVAGEQRKHGVATGDLAAVLDRFGAHGNLRCVGLMLIPPLGEEAEASRPHFAALRALRDAERGKARANVDLVHLSMGMSHDLEVAIAEGATLVRVGTAIFGERTR